MLLPVLETQIRCFILYYTASKCRQDSGCSFKATVNIWVFVFLRFYQPENPVLKHSVTAVAFALLFPLYKKNNNKFKNKKKMGRSFSYKSSKPCIKLLLITGPIITLLNFPFLSMWPVVAATQMEKRNLLAFKTIC